MTLRYLAIVVAIAWIIVAILRVIDFISVSRETGIVDAVLMATFALFVAVRRREK